MRTMTGTPITVSTFDNTPAELVELGIAGVRRTDIDYLATRINEEGIACPNPHCEGTRQVKVEELDTRWRFCPGCHTLWTIDELLGLVYILVQE